MKKINKQSASRWFLGILIFLWFFSGFQIINGIDQLGFRRTSLTMELYDQEQGRGRPEVIRNLQQEIDSLETFVTVNKILTFFVFPLLIGGWLIYSKLSRNARNLEEKIN
jgi:hypothetical protein